MACRAHYAIGLLTEVGLVKLDLYFQQQFLMIIGDTRGPDIMRQIMQDMTLAGLFTNRK